MNRLASCPYGWPAIFVLWTRSEERSQQAFFGSVWTPQRCSSGRPVRKRAVAHSADPAEIRKVGYLLYRCGGRAGRIALPLPQNEPLLAGLPFIRQDVFILAE